MIAFSVWPIDIYRYWVFYVVAFMSAYIFFYLLAKRKVFMNYPKIHLLLDKHTDDLILYCVLWVLLWGRLWHILIYDLWYYFDSPREMLQFRKWGMSFIGGMVWVSVSMIIFARKRKLKKSELLRLLDLILTITPLGIMFGRIWNFLNQELYGILVPYDFRWLSNRIISLFQKLHIFHVYDNVDSFLRINTNLLAGFFEWFLLFVFTSIILLKFIRKWIYRIGYITWFFLVRYSIARFFLEYLRMDSQSEFILYLTKSQRFFICFFFLWLYFLLRNPQKVSIR
jgi:phosphatidylglycerol:prolipoprotein diacylglycerol transferase